MCFRRWRWGFRIKAVNPHRLKENFEAQTIILTPEEIAQIDTLLDGLDLKVFGGHAVD